MRKAFSGGIFTYQCDAFCKTGAVKHGFSTRRGGESTGPFASLNLGLFTKDKKDAVKHNFKLFLQALSIESQHLVTVRQVHGTEVFCAGKEDTGRVFEDGLNIPEADALITDQPGVALATFSADCTPILFCDPVCRVIASVHSGWRGTVGKIAKKVAEIMQTDYGCEAKNILAAIGPSIKQCHFEVDYDVYQLFVEAFGKAAETHTVQKNGKYFIDTDSLNSMSLQEAGILKEHISVSDCCTFCKSEEFFSHRRSGGITGRMCAVIELQ